MELQKIVHSKLDSTLKYIFKTSDGFIVEFSYINKNDGKDIICVPCQTMCNLGCNFCHTKEYIGLIKCKNLTQYEIFEGVNYILRELKIVDNNRTLLISYMGIGEPILNVDAVIGSMISFRNLEKHGFSNVRFGLATSIPKFEWMNFFKLTEAIKSLKLPVKIHFSLHYTTDELRNEWMPGSLDILSSLTCLDFYKTLTGNPVEIHYALIEELNDSEDDTERLCELFKNRGMNVKFLFYNKKDSLKYQPTTQEHLTMIEGYLSFYNIPYEYYIPPGLDCGSSCGSFDMD